MPIRPTRWYDAYIFDLDGTIYLGEALLPGAQRTIETIRQRGIPVRFLSNNPTKTPQMYADKLTRLGLPTPVEDVTNTITTTLWWLKTHHPGATVFPIAEAPLIDALREAGITVSDDPSQIDIVIASYDRNFVYRDLQIAFDALWFYRRAILIQTNPDRYCPFPGGHGQPDAAAITAAIEACTQVKCSASLGKPSPLILEAAMAGLDVAPADALMTGDRLWTEIRMALDVGMPGAVVFTGDSQPSDVTAEYEGVFQLDSVDQILPVE